jgi:hypothetical protein
MIRLENMGVQVIRRIVFLATLILAALFTVHLTAGHGQAGISSDAPDSVRSSLETQLSPYTETGRIKLDVEQLYGVAVGSDDHIFVSADRLILVFEPTGVRLGRIELEEPARCLAVGEAGLLFLGMTDHVQVYAEIGERRSIWAGLGNEALITSIAASGDEIFIADAGNRLVMRFDTGGKLLDYIQGDGPDGPELLIPSPYFDLLITPEGTLWVVNPGQHRLQSYTVDGAYLGSWGYSSPDIDGFCGCCNPTHVALTPEGTFLTSEKGIPRIKEYDSSGTLKAVVAGPEQFAEGTVGLDLAADSLGRVIVLDPVYKAVRIFARKSP